MMVLLTPRPGLGTSIVQALAKELDASVDFVSDKHGTTVSIKHAALTPTATLT